MLNKQALYGVPLLVVLMVAVIYSQQNSSPAIDIQPDAEALEVHTVTSHAIAGDRIAMKHSVSGELQIDTTIMLELEFALSPGQLLELDFVASEQYQFNSELAAVYSADERGKLKFQLYLTPLIAGKIYVKVLAATSDGERVRPFSIPLRVKDNNGLVPQKTTVPKSRVILPVKGSS